jgi:L-erythro-3,5-diaminohexanoate dehydrogenase
VRVSGSPLGLHRVAPPERAAGVLPQAAWRLDPDPRIWPDEVRVRVDRLNLDAASFRQIRDARHDPDARRAKVAEIIRARGKLHNPVTGSGGMLTGVVDEVGADSPLGLRPGDRIATLVSLTLTPLAITDGLERWNGTSEQVPCDGHAILFGTSAAAVLPADLPASLALAVFDVCGAPALTSRVVASRRDPVVAILGASGKSGALCAAAARRAGAGPVIGVVPDGNEADFLRGKAAGLTDQVVVQDARIPVPLAAAVRRSGGPADVTVVCVDVAGCEGGAVLATADGGTVIFFSMATSFSAAALGAEGLVADVTMLIGNGYVPGHADLALGLVRSDPAVRSAFERRIREAGDPGS